MGILTGTFTAHYDANGNQIERTFRWASLPKLLLIPREKPPTSAEQFANYLASNPLYLENLRKKEAQWKASDLKNLEARATAEDFLNWRYDENHAQACKWIALGSGPAALALAPVVSGSGAILTILGAGTGLGDISDSC